MSKILRHIFLSLAVLIVCCESYAAQKVVRISESEDLSNVLVDSNSIYIIQYDFDLQNNHIVIGENSVLEFRGGSLANGTLFGNETVVESGKRRIFGSNLQIEGTWNVEEAYIEWFDNTSYINTILKYFGTLKLLPKAYEVSEPIYMQANSAIIGSNGKSQLNFTLYDPSLKCIYVGWGCIIKGVRFFTNTDNTMLHICGDHMAKSFNGFVYGSEENKNQSYKINQHDFRPLIEDVYIDAHWNMSYQNDGTIKAGMNSNAIELVNEGNDISGLRVFYLMFNRIFIDHAWKYAIYISQTPTDSKTPKNNRNSCYTDITFSNVKVLYAQNCLYIDGGQYEVTDHILFDGLSYQASAFTDRFAHIIKARNVEFSNCKIWDWGATPVYDIIDGKDVIKSKHAPFLCNAAEPNNIVLINTEVESTAIPFVEEYIASGKTKRDVSYSFNVVPSRTPNNGIVTKLSYVVNKDKEGKYISGELKSLAPGVYRVEKEDFDALNLSSYVNDTGAYGLLQIIREYNGRVYVDMRIVSSNTDNRNASLRFFTLWQNLDVNSQGAISEWMWVEQGTIAHKDLERTLPRDFGTDGNNLYYRTDDNKLHLIPIIGEDTRSSGTSMQRPVNVQIGFQYFDTTLNKPIYWTGKSWVDAIGNIIVTSY